MFRHKKTHAVLAVFALCALFCALPAGEALAEPSGTPAYDLPFDYLSALSVNGNAETLAEGSSVLSASVRSGKTDRSTLSVRIWGGTPSGKGGVFGGYLNTGTVSVSVESGTLSASVSVLDGNGRTLKTGEGSVSVSGLPDGVYGVSANGSGAGWLVNNRQFAQCLYALSAEFAVDCTRPVLSGGSPSPSGKYANADFTVSASDTGSGVEEILMKTPGKNAFTHGGGTSVSVPASAGDGLYAFRAVDRAGNLSEDAYVFLDTSAPKVLPDVPSGISAGPFSVSAADDGGGVKSMETKRPGSSVWEEYVPGTPVSSGEGMHRFRAADRAGNVSGETSVLLDKTPPTGRAYGGEEPLSGTHTNAECVSYVAADSLSGAECSVLRPGSSAWEPYAAGTPLLPDGRYVFRAVDGAGNVSTETIAVKDTVPPSGRIVRESGASVPPDTVWTREPFAFVPDEAPSGEGRALCLRPGSSTWEEYVPGTVVGAGSPDGRYAFTVSDEAGNVSGEYSITLDRTKPECVLRAGNGTVPSGTVSGKGPIVFSAADGTSGVKAAYAKPPGADGYVLCPDGAVFSADGLYRFYCLDNAGNYSPTFVLTLDTVPPSVRTDPPGPYSNGNVSVSATDGGSGISSAEVLYPGESVWRALPPGGEIPSSSGDGEYSFRAADGAGNVSPEVKILLDTVPPEGRILPSGEGTLRFVSSDGGSGPCRAYVRLPGESSWTDYDEGAELSGDGEYVFSCEDGAGNRSKEYAFTLDTDAPVAVFRTAAGPVEGGYVSADFGCFFSDAGVLTKTEMKRPGSSVWEDYEAGDTVYASSGDGEYSFRAEDGSGNVSECRIVLDTVRPSGKTYGGETAVENGSAVSAAYVSFVPSDDLSGPAGCFAEGPGEEGFSPYVPGTHLTENGLYRFYSSDKAGNTSGTFSVTLDNVPPVLSCGEVPFHEDSDGSFAVSAEDGLTGVSLYVRRPGEEDWELSPDTTLTVPEDAPSGRYSFRAVDGAGNVSGPVWINLSVSYPEAIVKRDERANTVSISWDGDCEGKLNGEPYAENAVLRAEGDYVFVLTDRRGRSSSYTFSITHVWYPAETVPPTCTEDGYTLYRCDSCGGSHKGDPVPALSHDWREETVAATCTEPGGTRHYCARCGEEYLTDEVPAFGHSYVSETIPPTCTEDGCVRHTCAVCGHTFDTDVLPAPGHDFATEVKTPATCTEDGLRTYVCTRCGKTKETVIPAPGHRFSVTDRDTGDGRTERTYVCTVCGYSYTEDLGDRHEEVSDYVSYLFDRYSPYMLYVFLGTAGVWSAGMGTAFIVARRREDREKARAMVRNYLVGLVAIAVILVACPYLVKGIAAVV